MLGRLALQSRAAPFKIAFVEEKTQESFVVNISPEIQGAIMTIISGVVAAQANELAKQMAEMAKNMTGQSIGGN